MYVDSDFLLALVADDWLGETAGKIYEEYEDDLWTSADTLLELLFVARRSDRDALKTVVAAKELVEVEGDVEAVLAAASLVEDRGMTPFDALHHVRSGPEPVVFSDRAYDDFPDRLESLIEE